MRIHLPSPHTSHQGQHPLDVQNPPLPLSLVWGQGWLEDSRAILLGPMGILFGGKRDWSLPSVGPETGFIECLALFATNSWFGLALGWVVWLLVLLPGLVLLTIWDLCLLLQRERPYKVTLDAANIWIERLGLFESMMNPNSVALIPRAQLRDVVIETSSPQSLLSTVHITTNDQRYPSLTILRAKKPIAQKRAETLARLLGVPMRTDLYAQSHEVKAATI